MSHLSCATINLESVHVYADVRFVVASSDLAYLEAHWWPDQMFYVVREQGPKEPDREYKAWKFLDFNKALSFLCACQWYRNDEGEGEDEFLEESEDVPEEFEDA